MDNLDQFLEQYVAISGLRIQVLARACACRTAFARGLHERLAAELNGVLGQVRAQIGPDADPTSYSDAAYTIHLLDVMDFSDDYREYRLNNGRWQVLDNDSPCLIPCRDSETEGLSRFIDELNGLGVLVTADVITYDNRDVADYFRDAA